MPNNLSECQNTRTGSSQASGNLETAVEILAEPATISNEKAKQPNESFVFFFFRQRKLKPFLMSPKQL